MTSVLEYSDYRQFLKEAIGKSTLKNSQLSTRVLAEKFSLSPSYLSRVLSGQRKLSLDSASKISRHFNLSADETLYFFDLVEMDNAKTEEEKAQIGRWSKRQPDAQILSEEHFKVVSDWYHFAILSLMRSKKFKSDIHWISHRLDLEPTEVRQALERLQHCGLVTVEKGKYVAVENANFQTTEDVFSGAIQENHRQHLKLADSALAEFAPELREFINRTLNLNISDIPEAKRKIRNFIKKFDKEMDKQENGAEVFHIDIQFYQVTKKGTR